jgi:hypothetical protein
MDSCTGVTICNEYGRKVNAPTSVSNGLKRLIFDAAKLTLLASPSTMKWTCGVLARGEKGHR